MLDHCFAEIWTRQGLEVWQAAVVVTEASHGNRFHRFWAPDQTGVAQFRHSVCSRRRLTERRSCAKAFCAEVLLFFVATDVHSQSFCEFFAEANVSSFFITETSFSNKFEQLSFAWLFASLSSSAVVSLNTSSRDRCGKKWSVCRQIVLFGALNDKSVASLIG